MGSFPGQILVAEGGPTLAGAFLRAGGINRILAYVTVAMVPCAALLLWSQLTASGSRHEELLWVVAGIVATAPPFTAEQRERIIVLLSGLARKFVGGYIQAVGSPR